MNWIRLISYILINDYILFIYGSRFIKITTDPLFIIYIILVIQNRNMISKYIIMSIVSYLITSITLSILLIESNKPIDIIDN